MESSINGKWIILFKKFGMVRVNRAYCDLYLYNARSNLFTYSCKHFRTFTVPITSNRENKYKRIIYMYVDYTITF